MVAVFLTFTFSVVVIVVAGTLLTWCADSIAEHTGLGKLFVGSIFLAGATSLPELTTGLNAIWIGLPDMAAGDMLGSCLFNLLILAGVDLAFRSRTGMLSRLAAAHALSGLVTIALVATLAIGVILESRLAAPSFLGMGPATLVVLLGYFVGVRLIYVDQLVSMQADKADTPLVAPKMAVHWASLGYLAAAAIVFLIAPMLTKSAGRIAEISGLGETFIGSTLLALTTSLPELVATVVAIRIAAPDLAVGNIMGSNALNIAVLVPLDIAFPGSLLQRIDLVHAFTCMAVILITSVIVVGQLYRVERRIAFIEPDAAVVMGLVLASLWLLYLTG